MNKIPLYKQAYFYFGIAFVITMMGFWPSFFRRLGDTDPGHMIHGISATLWMIIPVVQAWLISRQNYVFHRWIGRITFLLVPVFVLSGLYMIKVMLSSPDDPILAGPLREKLAFIDLGAMLFFITVFGLALKNIYQRNVKAHAQYMTCTILSVLEPSFERILFNWIPGVGSLEEAFYTAIIIMELIVATLIYIDWRTDRIRIPYCMTLAFFLVFHAILGPATESEVFQSFVQWIVAF